MIPASPTGRAAVAALMFGCLAVGTLACREREAWPAPPQGRAVDGGQARTRVDAGDAPSTAPRPGDPTYGEYLALEPTDRIFDHFAHLIVELLRVRTRLELLDDHKYARWIREYDQEIRALLAIWCPDTFAGYGLDLAHTPIAALFPLEYVEAAHSARCGGLWVDGKIQQGRAFRRDDRGDAGP